MVVLAYLMAEEGLSSQAAFDLLAAERRIANMPRLGGIMPQWRGLLAYETHLRARGKAS